MWRPDRSVRGPDLRLPATSTRSTGCSPNPSRTATVGMAWWASESLSSRTIVWRYALEDAGDGAMVWRDADGHIVAFNMVHQSGTEGWMGPLAVRPDRQGEGIGSMMVLHGLEWLARQGATTIGLETMPRTVDNIGFYSRIATGARASHRDPGQRHSAPGGGPPRAAVGGRRRLAEARIEECRRLTDALLPGVDFTREITLTRELRIGDTTMVREDGATRSICTLAFCPSRRRTPEGRITRAQTGRARPIDDFDRLLDAVQASAAAERVDRMAIRCQSEFTAVLSASRGARLPSALDRSADVARGVSPAGAPGGNRNVELGNLRGSERTAKLGDDASTYRPITIHSFVTIVILRISESLLQKELEFPTNSKLH